MISWIRSLDRVLKGEATKPAALRTGTIDLPLGGLTALLIILGVLYGCCMGAFAVVSRWSGPVAGSGWLQLVYSAVKVPMLFVLTLLITLPSLYVFNALVGCRLVFSAVLRLLVAALGVTLAVLASFGTIVVFFSLCSTSYPFMVLLNVLMFAVAGILGMNFLLQTLHRLAVARSAVAWEQQSTSAPQQPEPEATIAPPAPPPLPELGAIDRLEGQTLGRHVKTVFTIWVLVFGLIGAQMGWVLRPFIGSPSAPVTFFRAREGNFFQAVANRMADLVGSPGTGAWQEPARR
jgi:hypothetical protein